MLFKCDCNEKQYTITTNTIKNIIRRAKFIYERTGNTEAEILKKKRDRVVEEDESIEVGQNSSDRVLRSQSH